MSDADSLFGSPPPSPASRGRSPSLALPEHPSGNTNTQSIFSQNVGTIALPGSHNRSSELPVFIDPALPSGNTNVPRLRPPAPNRPASHPSRPASRPTRVTSRLPSPAPSHTPHTDQTLRDLVGLISHFDPVATAPSTRPPPITVSSQSSHHAPGTQQNPIEVDATSPTDAVNSALVALACTAANALKLPTTPHDAPLSQPIVNNVLYYIKHDPKLIPTLQATHDYLGSIPSLPPRSFSHVTTNQPIPKKTRRRKNSGPQIPAGAGHWDVPFPFAPGRGPNDYSSRWQLDRGRRVLGELLGLFERAFAKAKSDDGSAGAPELPAKRRRTRGPESSVASEFEGSIARTNVPPPDTDSAWLDHQRMFDWLSTIPGLSASSSIVESTGAGTLPSPSPSDPAPSPSDNKQDLMALLTPNFFGDASPPDGLNDHYPQFDVGDAFDGVNFDVDGKDDTDLHSMFGLGPPLQSINDITAFPMGISEPQSPAPQPHPLSHEFVIDPVLMALSQQPQPQPQPAPGPFLSTTQTPSPDAEFPPAASKAATSLVGLSTADEEPVRPSPHLSHSGSSRVDTLRDAHAADAGQLRTAPTTSASSSRRESTPATWHAMSPAPSTSAGVETSTSSRAQRKAAVLEKAREHRARLVREIESAKMRRWETVVEGGVLRNIGLLVRKEDDVRE